MKQQDIIAPILSGKNIHRKNIFLLSIMIGQTCALFAAESGTSAGQNIASVSADATNVEHEIKTINLIPGDSSFETGVGPYAFSDSSGGSATWLLDEVEKYDGRQSIKLCFLKSDRVRMPSIPISKEQAGRVFTFSVYAKADQDGISGKLSLIQPNWCHTHQGQTFNLTRNWQRYSLTGQLQEGSYWLCFESGKPCHVWVDAWQLEESDKPTPYHNREIVNFGINIPLEHGLVFFPDEPVKVRIQALNQPEYANSLPLTWRVSDYSGRTVREGQKQINLDKEGYGREEFIMTGLKLGFYAVRAGLMTKQGKIEALSTFVVVNPPVEIEEGQIPFCGIIRHEWSKGAGRLGSRWIDLETTWSEIEKTKGKYDWTDADYIIANNPDRCRIKLVLPHFPSVPEWAWDKADAAEIEAKKIKPRFGLLPDAVYLENWREFVRQFAERYKDKADIFEVGGEDDLTFGFGYYLARYKEHVKNGFLVGGSAFERYADMISIACHEIRKTAPKAKIGVIRPSGVDCIDSSPRYTFSEAVLRQCGTNLEFSVFPLDCYTGCRFMGPDQPATALPETFLPDALNGALDLCRKYGRGQPVYISEFGYAMDITLPPDSEYAREMVKRLTRSYLIARMTKGVESLHWFLTVGFIEGGIYDYGIWRDGLPLPSAAAYSAVARVVENVREAREIPMGNVKAAVFRKKAHADAAIWLVKGEGKIILNNPPEYLTITDVMGSSVAGEDAGDKTTIAIGEEPVYLNLPGSNSFDRLCNVLESAGLHIAPLQIQFAVPQVDKGTVILHNQTMQDLKAKVVYMAGNVVRTNEVWIAKGGKTEMPIALAEHEDKISVEADCGAGFEKVAESFPVGGYMVCKRITAPVTIDGEWRQGRQSIVMNERGQIMPPDPWVTWSGTNDLSVIVYTGWDENNFYFAAEVWDDLHFNDKSGGGIWEQDAVQVAFAPLVMTVGSPGYGANDTEIGLALAQGKPEAAQWNGLGTVWRTGNYAVKRDEARKITRYKAEISWVTLGINPKPGKVFGFNFVVLDDDTGAGQNYWYQLSPGITNGKNPALFKRFILSE